MSKHLNIHRSPDAGTLGKKAGRMAAASLRETLALKGEARIILATGASQFAVLEQLVRESDINWKAVTMFHLDEYIGLPISHPASFRHYLQKRFLERVPALKAVHLIDGEAKDPARECERLGELVSEKPVDLALIGIGENGHLAFNDPPADMQTDKPYIVVRLDKACRMQQVGEGWFEKLEEVPEMAITMSITQILKTRHLICSVPDARKADAVYRALRGPLSPDCPASALQGHPSCDIYLDEDSAARL